METQCVVKSSKEMNKEMWGSLFLDIYNLIILVAYDLFIFSKGCIERVNGDERSIM